MTAYILIGFMGNGHVTEALHVFFSSALCVVTCYACYILEHMSITIQNRGDPNEREELQLLRDSEQTPALPGYNATLWCSEVLVHCVRKQRVTTICFKCHRPSVGRLTLIRLLFKYETSVTRFSA
jgi:hypothetical protein